MVYSSGIGQGFWSLKRRLRQCIAESGYLAPVYYAWHRDHDQTRRGLTTSTKLVVDAYPRSANSTFTRKLIVAQGSGVGIAHHLHASGVLVAAARRGIPAVTILREAKDAVASYALYMSCECLSVQTSLDVALREYIGYYEGLVPYREGIAVLSFSDVISDFQSCVSRVNSRFMLDLYDGTNVAEFETVSDMAIKQVHSHYAKTDDHARNRNPQPSIEKQLLKERYVNLLATDRYGDRLATASRIGNQLLEGG